MEALQDSVSQMSQMFLNKLAQFEERQQKINSGASTSDSTLIDDFAAFKSFTLDALRVVQTQVELLSQRLDVLEMHSRRKILLIHGCSEDKKEDISSIIAEVVTQKLKLTGFTTADISRCHRMGKSANQTRPRPILVKLRDMALRGKIWKAKSSLKGTGITLSEFLTKVRHDVFMEARQRFGLTKSWTHDGSVFVVSEDGERYRVNSFAELHKVGVKAAPALVATKQSTPARDLRRKVTNKK